jgi:hypothetical protein
VVNFFMHVVTLMRVRGNLLRVDGRWRLRFVPLGDSWQLSLGRDFTDSTMLRLAQHMIWCVHPFDLNMNSPFNAASGTPYVY